MKPLRYSMAVMAVLFGSLALNAQIQFNEIFFNPPGTDNGNEFVEIAGPPNSALTNVWLVVIEGDAANAGVVDQAVNLTGNTIGANGLFLQRDAATVLLPPPNAQTSVLVQDFVPDIENGCNTYLLVSDFSGTVGTDLDTDNNGTLDLQPWTGVYDAVAFELLTGVYNVYADDLGFPVFPGMSFLIEALLRVNGQWAATNVFGTAPGPFPLDSFNTRFIDTSALDLTTICPATLTPGSANPVPNNLQVSLSSTNSCPGLANGSADLALLSGTAPYVFNWSNGETTEDLTALPSDTFSVTVTAANGCVASESIVVGLGTAPAVTALGPTEICDGTSAALAANGAVDYLWSTGASGAGTAVSPTVQTTYSVTGTDAAGCTASADVTVDVLPVPSLSINAPADECAGTAVSLTATSQPGNGFVWSQGATTATISVAPLAQTSYSVTVTDASGCTASAAQTVGVLPNPTVSVSGPAALCTGASSILTAAGGDTYLWDGGETIAAISIAPAATTVYSVTVTDSNTGCSASAAQTVDVTNNPTATITGTASVCAGNGTVLTASGADAYQWSNGETNQSISIAPATDENLSVTVTYPGNCTASASVSVTVNANPTAGITGITTFCDGDSTQLTANGGGSYLWGTGETTASVTVGTTNTNLFWVTVTAPNGCTASADINVTVLPSPIAEINGPTEICSGDLAILTATGGSSYLWSNGETTADISVSPLGTTDYSVTVTNVAGCSDDTDATVEVFPAPTPIVTESNFVLTISGSFAQYEWYFNGQLIAGANGQSITAVQNGAYTVVVTDANGCTAESDPINITGVGLNEAGTYALRVFPNPASGLFTVETEHPFTGTAFVFDAQGRQVARRTANGQTALIFDLTGLGNGTFVVRLVSDQQVRTVPVLIAR